jgi:Tfp pilus assembly protein PilN
VKAVNLLPQNRERAKSASSALTRHPLALGAGAVGAVVVAGLGFLVWNTDAGVSNKQNQLNAVQAQIAAIHTPVASSIPGTPVGAASQATVVTALVNGRLPWDEFLSTLSKVLPENAWLTSMQASGEGAAVVASTSMTSPGVAPAAATPSTSNPFTVTGYTYSAPSVARVMRRLELVPWLSDINLISTSQTAVGKTTLYTFTIAADVNQVSGS